MIEALTALLSQLLPPGPLRLALPLFPWCLLGAGLLLAAFFDLRWRRVPNWLNLSLLLCGLVARAMVAGWLAALLGLAGAASAFVLLLFPFQRRWIGAGDVKLLIAIGGWLGPLASFYATLLSAALGGIVSLIWLVRSPAALRKEIAENLKGGVLTRSMPAVGPRPAAVSPPMAPAIAAGTIALLLLFWRMLVS